MAHYVFRVSVTKVSDQPTSSKYSDTVSSPEPLEVSQFVVKGADLTHTVAAVNEHLKLVIDPFLRHPGSTTPAQ